MVSIDFRRFLSCFDSPLSNLLSNLAKWPAPTVNNYVTGRRAERIVPVTSLHPMG